MLRHALLAASALALASAAAAEPGIPHCHQVRPGVESLMLFVDESGNPRVPTNEEVAELAAETAKSLGEPEEVDGKESGIPAIFFQGRLAAQTPGVVVASVTSANKGVPATINIVSTDGVGEGTNDPTVVSPVGGNPGTTLGAQRINAMAQAAQFWANKLDTNVQIDVSVNWAGLACSAGSGTLGSAGATTGVALGPGFPNTDCVHSIALANQILNQDIIDIYLGGVPADAEISASFNSKLDDPAEDATCLTGVEWYYGYDNNPPVGDQDFYQVFLHEVGHGLGFATYVNLSTGARVNISGTDYDDHYMLHLRDESLGLLWYQMSNAQRQASAIDNGDLTWDGTNVTNFLAANPAFLTAGEFGSTNRPRMYAPGVLVGGSSVSHFDEVLDPHELMEPIADPSPLNVLTQNLMLDIGWTGALPVELQTYDVE